MVKIDKVFFSYKGVQPYVLNDINLEINKGEYVSVLGANGSGKSTLMRLILKFLKPTKGKITSQAKRIGYVPQRNDFSNSSFPISVYESLNSYRRLLKVKNRDVIEEILGQVGMSDYSNALVGTLSSGQSQKIQIGRSLIGNPDLLILDEPSTGVDIKSQGEIYTFLKKINEEKGITIVSVEHNLDAAIANSTLIYHLVEGRGHPCSPLQYLDEFLKKRRNIDVNF